ncbi:hypothetical protein EON63_12840 [archaeon]|nr:MAG: hypothetical protein EON63_12840 [archaeon]
MSAIMSEEDRVKEVIVESRIQKVLSLRTDSIVMLEALDAISEFYTTSKLDILLSNKSKLVMDVVFAI